MENLEKDTNYIKGIKFRSNLFIIWNLYLNIRGLISEIALFGEKHVAMYIVFPICCIMSYIWIAIYYISAVSVLKKYKDKKSCCQCQYDRLKTFKDKYVLGNTYSFLSVNLLWNSIIAFGYTWFMIFENNHKWWIILIGIIVDLIYAFFLLITCLFFKDLQIVNKDIDKNLKEFEETNNVRI